MLDLAICNNDEERLYKIEKEIVKALFNENELNIDLYDSDVELCDVIKQGNLDYDIVFINIDLNSINGFDLASMIREYNTKCEIVFTNDVLDNPLQAFKYRAFDYLVNPIDYADFSNLFDRYSLYHFSNKEEYFSFKSRRNQEKIKISSIQYFASSGRKISIITPERKFEFYSKLDDVETILGDNSFIRIHQSYLINPAYVKYIVGNDTVMENGDYLPISRNRIKSVRNEYMEYLR